MTDQLPRTRAASLALVNWKGCFFESYELDEHVTALEGSNGAGKTTVMIAAYIVLLPDLTYLRFSNVGEGANSGADRGIYGRLGEPGPAYAALDFRPGDGRRVVAGVHIHRKTRPSLELRPFLIDGLEDDVPLSEVMLRREDGDYVPTPDEMAEAVEANEAINGRLRWFDRNKSEYFQELFDRGVTPVRMVSSEERRKMNEMLHTSMVGGISRALQGGLRDFLLKPDRRLGDTVRRMQQNLQECRRTRMEVEQNQSLQEEIREIYEAGRGMFAAAGGALRRRKRELFARLESSREQRDEVRRKKKALSERAERLRGEAEGASDRRDRARIRLEQARAELERTERAHELASRLEGKRQELDEAEEARAKARAEVEEAREALEAVRERQAEINEERDRVADQLSDFETAFQDIHRKVGAWEEAKRRLERVREALGDEVAGEMDGEIDRDMIPELLERGESEVEKAAEALHEVENELDSARRRRERFDEVAGALETIEEDLGGEHLALQTEAALLDRADAALAALRDLKGRAERRDELQQTLEDARRKADRQQSVRRKVADLAERAGRDEPWSSGEALEAALGEARQAIEEARESVGDLDSRIRQQRDELRKLKERSDELAEAVPVWKRVQREAETLETTWECALEGREDLAELRERLEQQRDAVRESIRELNELREQLRQEAEELRMTGGDFDPGIVRARDRLDARLVAERYEDVSVEQAARVEALLGPLRRGLIVEDVREAAEKLATMDECPETVWLMTGGSDSLLEPEEVDEADWLGIGGPEAKAASGSTAVLVEHGDAWRLTSPPDSPAVGRAAREARIQHLQQQLEEAGDRLVELRERRQQVDAGRERLREVAERADYLQMDDPEAARDDLEERRAALKEDLGDWEAELQQVRDRLASQRELRDGLEDVLPGASLLGTPDWQERAAELKGELQGLQASESLVEQLEEPRTTLNVGREELRREPPTDDELEGLQERRAELEQRRDRWARPLEAMRYLVENGEHLEWAHWKEVLEEKREVRTELVEERERLAERLETTKAELAEREEALDAATGAFHEADGQVKALEASVEELGGRLEELEVEEADDEALRRVREHAEEARDEVSDVRERADGVRGKLAKAETELEHLSEKLEELEATRKAAAEAWEPCRERWERFRERAEEEGVLTDALAGDGEAGEDEKKRDHNRLLQEATNHRARLETLLERSDGADEFVPELDRLPDGEPAEAAAGCLEDWLEVRGWLQRRVPAEISQSEDPLEALEAFNGYLARLEQRLREKEADLRQDTSAVATNIQSKIRRVHRQVRQLNHDLRHVGFGSIRAVRLDVERIDRMDELLRALDNQGDLFAADTPVEEALAQLFERVGGGKIKGERLLDYREYIQIGVAVVREGSDTWESADPSRLSTGEAIGVGAAVMMVILKAWEHDATVLRGARSSQSLRFLFLDEANRLSRDNLRVLFELCEHLDLQLLIAAPDVAQAPGATTYRLVRTTDDAGREVVRVTGRRIISEDEEPGEQALPLVDA